MRLQLSVCHSFLRQVFDGGLPVRCSNARAYSGQTAMRVQAVLRRADMTVSPLEIPPGNLTRAVRENSRRGLLELAHEPCAGQPHDCLQRSWFLEPSHHGRPGNATIRPRVRFIDVTSSCNRSKSEPDRHSECPSLNHLGRTAGSVSGARNPSTAYANIVSGTSESSGGRNRQERTESSAAASKPEAGPTMR